MYYTYTDSYLKNRVTEDIEATAMEEIDAIREFPDDPIDWREKLVVLRTYILSCLEQTSASDDVFAVKLTHYRKEYDSTLSRAHAAANALEADQSQIISLQSIDLERA